MTDLLVDPDIETVVIDYLNAWLALIEGEDGRASDKTHEGRNVRVIQTGGSGRIDVVLSGFQLTFDSYDDSESDAGELARRVGALVHNLAGTVQDGVTFTAVRSFAAAANLPDPLDDRPRYTQTFEIFAKAQVLTV